jgi:glycerol-3-phosphate O-acyltransferase
MDLEARLEESVRNNELSEEIAQSIRLFFRSYKEAVKIQGGNIKDYLPFFDQFIEMVKKQLVSPYQFEPYHAMITTPIDYYHFGLDFLRPLILLQKSNIQGLKNIDAMADQIKKGHNVILFANHQIEPDPQAISILLNPTHPQLAKEMIFVAGHRVTTDPMAIPFSMGRNLLCIYSKKHIDHPPEKKEGKLLHNQKTMQRLVELLSEGGKCIYVAPSGGRDRPDINGFVDVAPFDPQSIEMFRLMSQKAKTPTHFYPLSLVTYNLLPPPSTIMKELGEHRHTRCSPIHLFFGDEIDMNEFPGNKGLDKHDLRTARAKHIWSIVQTNYQKLNNDIPK